MRYYNTGDFLLGQLSIDHMRQAQADGLIDATRADVGDLVAGDIRDVQELWDGINELLDSETYRVASGLSIAATLRGDCSTGCEDGDIRKGSIDWCLDILANEESVEI